ncbi:MAG: DUF2252 family protein [Rhodocyclaceae bacterium]
MSSAADTLLERIRHNDADRDPERLALKYAAWRADPFAFLRGTAWLFNSRLPAIAALRDAPLAWACGDLHLENFGSYRGDNGLVYFDINDFDEARLAPATLDLLRLLVSVHVAAPGLEITPDEAGLLCAQTLETWIATLASGKPRWVERDTARGVVDDLLSSLRKRSQRDFLDSRTRRHGKQRRLRLDNGKALPLHEDEHDALLQRMRDFALLQDEPGFFKPLDAARRVSGNASLGLPRYIVLVRGEGSPDGNALLDLKFAAPVAGEEQQLDPAARLIAIQTRMQAVPNAFLQSLEWRLEHFVLRDLQPAQDRVDLALCRCKPKRLASLLQTQVEVLAWAQLRSAGQHGSDSMEALQAFAARKNWRAPLLRSAQQVATQTRRDWQNFRAAG